VLQEVGQEQQSRHDEDEIVHRILEFLLRNAGLNIAVTQYMVHRSLGHEVVDSTPLLEELRLIGIPDVGRLATVDGIVQLSAPAVLDILQGLVGLLPKMTVTAWRTAKCLACGAERATPEPVVMYIEPVERALGIWEVLGPPVKTYDFG
jgi:hypothetical protein